MNIPATKESGFLSSTDIARVQRVLGKIRDCGLTDFDLTGSLALECHRRSRGGNTSPQAVNDIDILVSSFAALPVRLIKRFLARHIHPDAEPGKIVLQLVDADNALRIDIFSAKGRTRERGCQAATPFGILSMVSVEDLAANTASLLMSLDRGDLVPEKHARHFRSLATWAETDGVESAWQDHRKPHHPSTFAQAAALIAALLKSKEDLLVVPAYEQDTETRCAKCREPDGWELAPANAVLSILGYV